MRHALARTLSAAALALTALSAAPPANASTQVGGLVAGSSGYYDYGPTVIQAGQTQDFWWCGDTAGRLNDTVFHQQYSLSGGVHITIPQHPSLVEGPAGAWDSQYVCNPDVVEGAFTDPFGDGVDYAYAMYYVGTSNSADNAIGVAFSTSGDSWRKYPDPVVLPTSPGHGYYGVGQPNVSLVAGVWVMLYEDDETPNDQWGRVASGAHAEATSPDGLHWTTLGAVSTAGLADPGATWGGAAYDGADGRWYAAYHEPLRDPATTGGVVERGQSGVTLYAAPDPLAGPWTALDTIDTVTTGFESNFLPGLLRGADGDLYGPNLPSVTLYLSTSNPRPAYNAGHTQLGQNGAFNNWDIAWSIWTPGSPLRKLTRYVHAATSEHLTTTGYAWPYYTAESVNLGHLYEAPAGDAATALYSCRAFSTDFIPSTDPGCLGQYRAGLLGYLYSAPGTGRIALYRCTVPQVGDFISARADCEGKHADGLIGYSAP